MIFGKILTDPIVQVNDMFRINVAQTFVTPDSLPIKLLRIRPEATDSFYSITSSHLDWQYSTDGEKVITLEVTTGDNDPMNDIVETFSRTVTAIDEDDEYLFSNDDDLVTHENDIQNYLPAGKSSFVFKHREAQKYILEDLLNRRITQRDGKPIERQMIFNLQEVRLWSTYLTLYLIFNSNSNAVDDIFSLKALEYKKLATRASHRNNLTFDTNGDGEANLSYDLRSIPLVRR